MVRRRAAKLYQLKVTLADSKPPIWRRIVVAGNTRLDELHVVLQIVMGWTDSHLHRFIIGSGLPKRGGLDALLRGGQYYSDPEFGLEEAANETKVRLDEVVGEEKFKFLYEYDMGDSWMHEILVEKISVMEPDTAVPRCLEGKLAGPPEDIGGIGGYYEMLEALADPKHEQHEDMKEWIGEYDPEHFDLAEVNAELKEAWGQ
ncbi:MAG TPA: plasmid pRiA4b ORF-3 family protein [Tepidisphaeraceae bacterium]|nr:plasmid pRiA4b ORF-3 family protein [Tepidisphaeraceae bacterium]